MTLKPDAWELVALLPNLALPNDRPFDGGELRICSAGDPAVQALAESPANATGLALLERFVTVRQTKLRPCVLLARSRAPQLLYHDVLRDFRNLCAIATVVAGRTAQLGNGSNWLATHSDFFTFAHHVAGKDGAIVSVGRNRSWA